jgi:hypothetical protein
MIVGHSSEWMTRPSVLPEVFYPDMRGWQRLGVKLGGQCSPSDNAYMLLEKVKS